MTGLFPPALTVIAVTLVAVCWAAPAARAETVVTVFAAASLTDAISAAGARFTEATGVRLRFSFAASSTLARQIEAGAPADLFASANQAWMDYLSERRLVVAATRSAPIANRLVLVAPADGSAVPIDLAAAEAGERLHERLGDGRLAVGDPDHVPAGIYARQALESLGLWDALGRRLARADNARAALALVARGEAPLGIVYATDAAIAADRVTVVGAFPPASHRPIAYPFAVVSGAETRPPVMRLHRFLTGPAAAETFARFGFVPP